MILHCTKQIPAALLLAVVFLLPQGHSLRRVARRSMALS